jgi:anti-anti-sigma factor
LRAFTHSVIEVDRLRDGTRVIKLSGEFDMTQTQGLHRRLTELLDGSRLDAVVDLRRVTFIDSKFLRTLVLTLHPARRGDRRIVLIRPSSPLWRVFEVTGLDTLFPVFDSLDDATSSLLVSG